MVHTENKVRTLVSHVLKDAYYAMDLRCRIVQSVIQLIMVPIHIINILEKIHAHSLVPQASILNLELISIVRHALLFVTLAKYDLIIVQQLMDVLMEIILIMQQTAALLAVHMAYMRI